MQKIAENDSLTFDEKIEKLEEAANNNEVDSSFYEYYGIDPETPDSELSEEQRKNKRRIQENFKISDEVVNLAVSNQIFPPSYGTCLWKLDRNSDEFKKRQKTAALAASLVEAANKAKLTGETADVDKIVKFIREKGGYTGDLGKSVNEDKTKFDNWGKINEDQGFYYEMLPQVKPLQLSFIYEYLKEHPETGLEELGLDKSKFVDPYNYENDGR